MINKLFLDLNNFKPNLGSVERGDSIELNIKLLNDEDYSRSKFRLLGTKADGKYVEQIEGINLEEKDLKVILEDQFVNCESIVKLELNVVSGETEITTKEFYFFVSNTMNGEIVESSDSVPTLEKVSKYVDDAVNNLDALKEASEDITIINSEFKENEIKRKANELLRERSEKERVRLESIRTTEEADRIKAEAERKEAENNRKVAENNRKLNENTRKTNEAARVEAELNRQFLFEENEEIRNENEKLRIEAEKERKLTFSNNNKFESERVEAEKLRVAAEDKRVTSEKARAKAEEERIKAETRREGTYTDFNDSEVERKNNEANRVRAEAERVNAESGRNELFNSNEEKRNNTFVESERARERAFNEAQTNRSEAYEESERVREEAFKVSEATRNEAEEGRVAEELLRGEAENNREVAESKRVKAESARVEAEKLRVSAETGRVEAENLRVTAEEGRVAAETKREEGFNKFEGKINANTEELKNARTATTGEKFNSLDERIDCEVDRLNKKIEVSMLQQEDKESHTIENAVNGMTTDTVIKGRTLQNLEPSHQVSMNIGSWNTFTNGSVSMYKPNTKYTVIVIVEDNKLNGEVQFIGDDNNVQTVFKTGINLKIASGSTGVFSKTYTTKDDLSNCVRVGYWVHDPNSITGTLRYSMLILEGDWTNKPIPNYFEDIKSFGQQENKISYLSHGKNLLKPPLTNITKKQGVCDITLTKDGGFIINGTNSTTGGGRHLFSDVYFYKVTRGVSYTLSCTHVSGTSTDQYSPTLFLTNIDNHNDMPASINTISSTKKVTFVADKDMILFCGVNVNINQSYSNFEIKVMLEESKNVTQYEAYKEYKKDIALTSLCFDEGLRGLNNIVYDELNSITDKAIKKIEKYSFTGNENLERQSINEHGIVNFLLRLNTVKGGIGISNKLKQQNTNIANTLDEGFYFSEGIGIYIRVKESIANDVDMFKQLLREWHMANNPLEIYYELLEPVEIPLNESIALKVYDEKTYVSFENSISGTSSFKIPVDTVATIARLNRENRALEEENKTLRQDFESTTLVLTDSDLELVKQNVDMDFRLMEVEIALDIPPAILSSDIKFKNKKGEVKSMARTPYEMMKIVILSGDYDREDYIHKVGKYYERRRMTKEEHDELMSLMTADEVISK